jgi:hypothetical protein
VFCIRCLDLCTWGGGRKGRRGGRVDEAKTYLELVLGESTQIMRAVLIEAPCPERARGIHACPIMTKDATSVGAHSDPLLYTPFGIRGDGVTYMSA